jgi:hypothetical protein
MRNLLSFIIITSATILAAIIFCWQQPTQFRTVLLYSVGISTESATEKSFDATKLADDFSKTIAGWTRSPTFVEKLNAIVNAPIYALGANQAKQNFLLTLTANSKEITERGIAAAEQVLQEELAKYNANSHFKFFATRHGESSEVIKPNFILSILAAAIGGSLLSLVWIFGLNYFSDKINSRAEAEQILGESATVFFTDPENTDFEFLKILLKKLGRKNTLLAAINCQTKNLQKQLGELKIAEFPRDVDQLTRSEINLIVLVRLDESRREVLRQVRGVFDGKIWLAVWG